jgi:hypothetical protein
MPYEVSYDEQNNTVLVQVSGKATHEEHLSARKEAFRLCKENHCSAILVDLLNLDTEKSSTPGCFEFGEALAQGNVSPSTRIANVLPKEPKSADDVKFITTVATNRGRITASFDSIEQAKQWLLESTVSA